jgi:hypothetical protein
MSLMMQSRQLESQGIDLTVQFLQTLKVGHFRVSTLCL